jgi:molecular chaperone GrpE
MTEPETTDTHSTKDAAPEPAFAPASAEAKGDELAAARKEAAEARDRHLRAVADLENFRRRTVREKEELRLYAASRVLEDLLPVLDSLSLGLEASRQPNAELKTLVGGVEIAAQQLKAALANHGLAEINPAGQPFDPHRHEALSHQPSDTVPAEHVLAVVRTGFMLHNRLLRPASVIVSSGPAA